MRLYLDTNIAIYFVERNPAWHSKVNARLSNLVPGSDRMVISDLTIAECLVGPFKRANQKLEATYRRLFAAPNIEIVTLTRSASEHGARLRADFNFGLTDALHLAMAAETGCDSFYTNDAKLGRCPSIRVELLK